MRLAIVVVKFFFTAQSFCCSLPNFCRDTKTQSKPVFQVFNFFLTVDQLNISAKKTLEVRHGQVLMAVQLLVVSGP